MTAAHKFPMPTVSSDLTARPTRAFERVANTSVGASRKDTDVPLPEI